MHTIRMMGFAGGNPRLAKRPSPSCKHRVTPASSLLTGQLYPVCAGPPHARTRGHLPEGSLCADPPRIGTRPSIKGEVPLLGWRLWYRAQVPDHRWPQSHRAAS